uniref:Uncharacterized protein n=1 Tax=Clytia hemisphaerica TaxID=252671 RepID=A0A7M5X9K3_9CNID|eukprot:TCONS_00044997-protein
MNFNNWKTKPVVIKASSSENLHHSSPNTSTHQSIREIPYNDKEQLKRVLSSPAPQLNPARLRLPSLNLIGSSSTPNSPQASPLMQRASRLAPVGTQQNDTTNKEKHSANMFQIDGRKRSVSYSNFSNFYES